MQIVRRDRFLTPNNALQLLLVRLGDIAEAPFGARAPQGPALPGVHAPDDW